MNKHRKYLKHIIYGLVAINIAFLLGAVYRLNAENKILKGLIEGRADNTIGSEYAAYSVDV
ncbi:MAG: hypothetical protein KBC33_01660 [Candidatus Pacebacteria bacterium]|nr:hypothetical protein [Candidatus Paceibacterota bacterium]